MGVTESQVGESQRDSQSSSQSNYQSKSQRSTEVQALFNRIAPVYDQLNDWLSFGQHKVWKLMAVQWSGAALGDCCLDVCCGSGDLARLLAKQVKSQGQVYGVDFSVQQLQVAKETTPPHLAIEWLEGDALALPLADNYFDAATMGYGLRNVVDIPQALGELYRVLKPGAKAAILDFHQPQSSLVNDFQQWYLENIVVPMAERFNFTEEYAYLAPSLARFPSGREQVSLAKSAGFTEVVHYSIAFGLMGVLVAQK
ncbi:MAG: bifunctional demethylmenaquinone methyltransferase/2-methoxy-6-polyprenyl-1,4-benzoquinol methylase UbiE [Coleofasciculaceae cyanobacterium SM2_1_6]|nr:bifunctional demethylmenaquinone methyltransferase/2-methoxy-6-polyprenyl-1,4-benzoquinol methylase UbiE [Coleofasciculaceae cyanobacterium SM2_1_6]